MTLATAEPKADQKERNRRLRQCALSVVIAPEAAPPSEAAASIFCSLEDAHGAAGGPHFAPRKSAARSDTPEVSVSVADMSQPAPTLLFPPIVLLPHLGTIPALRKQVPAPEIALTSPPPAPQPQTIESIQRRNDPAERFAGPFPVANGCRRLRDAILKRVTAPPCALACIHLTASPHHASRLADLALALAETAEGDVLLLDADLGAFGLSRHFGVDDRPGLSEVLGDGRPWREAVHETALKRIQIMPTGLAISTALYAASADGLGILLDDLKKTFRFVLIAASAHQPRIAELTWAVDGAIVAIDIGGLPRPELLEQIAFLRRDGARLTACAVYAGP
ncbi:MAG: hypothetical protein HYS13_25635 [Planctomycetia bacterium]|nr:hypothetical protein [Planctomycetia bacterium]